MTTTPPRYDAFVSYRRSDGAAVARWLRRQLQGFRPPRKLAARHARRLRVYLDEAYERGTNDFYEGSIRPALMAARWLVVVATPDAAAGARGPQQDWIRREIADFERGPHAGNVLVVRGAGALTGPLPADLAERYPNVEIVDLRAASALAFLRPGRWLRLRSELLKVVAPLLELAPDEMPVLRQEEERRQQAWLGMAFGAVAAVFVAILVLAGVALQQAAVARDRLDDAMALTDGIVSALERELAQVPGAEETVAGLLERSCDLLDRLDAGADDPRLLRSAARCAQRRAAHLARFGETAQATARLEEAARLADAAARADPEDADLWAEARFAQLRLASDHLAQGRADDGRALLETISSEVAARAGAPGSEARLRATASDVLLGLASVAAAHEQDAVRAAALDTARRLLPARGDGRGIDAEHLARLEARIETAQAWRVQEQGDVVAARAHHEAALALRESLLASPVSPTVARAEAAESLEALGDLAEEAGALEAAAAHYTRAAALREEVAAERPHDGDALVAHADVIEWLSHIESLRERHTEASRHLERAATLRWTLAQRAPDDAALADEAAYREVLAAMELARAGETRRAVRRFEELLARPMPGEAGAKGGAGGTTAAPIAPLTARAFLAAVLAGTGQRAAAAPHAAAARQLVGEAAAGEDERRAATRELLQAIEDGRLDGRLAGDTPARDGLAGVAGAP